MSEKLYFAYGSNMNLDQMSFRCPNAEVVGVVRVDDYRLTFCGNGGVCGVATILPEPGSHVDGVLWRISVEDETVYMVKGLFSTWSEMLGNSPVLLDAVLLPFLDSIISDGLVVPYHIYFGKGAREGFKEDYMNAKRAHTIRFSF